MVVEYVGRDVANGQPIRVGVTDGRLTSIERAAEASTDTWITPGWLDIQVNGFGGHDPNDPGAGAAATSGTVRALWPHGVTGTLITICTQSEAHIAAAVRAIADACDADPLIAASVPGIHVEGPHIASEDGPRGAHPLRHVRPPDIAEFSRWQTAARGRITMVTLSPEYPGSVDYIRAVVDQGVVAAIAHTAADSDAIRAAVDAGATCSTHLGNGAHAMIRRHPNYVWDQLAEDRLSAGFIFDGHHLPQAVMQSVVRAKGVERSILVSDAVSVAGQAPGRYRLFQDIDVDLRPGGRLELAGTPLLAGAISALPACISNAIRHADLSLRDTMRMITTNPSRLLRLGIDAGHERLATGMAAN
ncbi:MAG: amidohydrolase family protein, partial [Chloroflexi bacterium]|nr:amidohydrolase family protein [Chloroflexota bacterium]